MATDTTAKSIRLPRNWPDYVKSAIVHVISLARVALVAARALAAPARHTRGRGSGSAEQLEQEIELLREELRIKDIRMATVSPRHRPRYRPVERLAILELKAARGWTAAETGRRFLVQPSTISSWLKRIDEGGKRALVRTREPVNKFPEFIGYIVRRLKVLCPTLGRKKLAQFLARAGLHLSASTVRRMLKEGGKRAEPSAASCESREVDDYRPVISRYPNHTWNLDLTLVPTAAGFWVPWFPCALAQAWPVCWWVAGVIDHFSRRVLGCAVFRKEPTSVEIRSFLGRVIRNVGEAPRYVISDKAGQFWCDRFKDWCDRRDIVPRYGSVGKIGSIAVLERWFRSLKEEWLRRSLVPFRREAMRRKTKIYIDWHNEHRPHESLGGRTPNEVCYDRTPANEKARVEPRRKWPEDSPCARPLARPKRLQGSRLDLHVKFYEGSRHLPIVELKQAA